MNKYIVIINGLGGVGKSEFISQCKRYCKEADIPAWVFELSVVDGVKEAARSIGWNGQKSEKDRQFLSDLKKALAKWNNIPLQYLYQEVEDAFIKAEINQKENAVIFINSRELPDIKEIEKKYSNEDIKICRIFVEKDDIINNEAKDIVDDIEEFSHHCNYKISNNGTIFQLFIAASVLIDDLLGINNEKLL